MCFLDGLVTEPGTLRGHHLFHGCQMGEKCVPVRSWSALPLCLTNRCNACLAPCLGSKSQGIFKDGQCQRFGGCISYTCPKPGFECYSSSTEAHHSLDVPSSIMLPKLGEFRICFPFQPTTTVRPSGVRVSKLVGISLSGDKPEPSLDAIP